MQQAFDLTELFPHSLMIILAKLDDTFCVVPLTATPKHAHSKIVIRRDGAFEVLLDGLLRCSPFWNAVKHLTHALRGVKHNYCIE